MPEEEARWIFQQLLVAVDYCQRLGVANRDIKVGVVAPLLFIIKRLSCRGPSQEAE